MAGSLGADLWAGNWLGLARAQIGGLGLAGVGLAGGKPGWTVTWLGLVRAQIGRGGSWHVGRRLAGEALIERPASSKGG